MVNRNIYPFINLRVVVSLYPHVISNIS